MKAAIRGLYAVTPDTADTALLCARVEAAIAGGARLVQYRNKTADKPLLVEQARALASICRAGRVSLIVNDSVEVALAAGADGLHVGAEDMPAGEARKRLGEERILGVSCYDRLADAEAAVAAGADYVAFGSFFPSSVKPDAVRPPLSLLGEARRRLPVPIVAIGGIDEANAPQVLAAGASAIAVISALFSAPDVRAAAQRLSRLCDNSDTPVSAGLQS